MPSFIRPSVGEIAGFMQDEEIREEIERACQHLAVDLYFQVSQNPPYLYIFINRPAGNSLDYARITTLIGETIADLNLENISYLAFYSRLLGEVNHDWEHCIVLSDLIQDTLVDFNPTLSEATIQQPIIFGLETTPTAPTLGDPLEDTEFVEHRATKPFADSEVEEETVARSPKSGQSINLENMIESAPAQAEINLNRADFSQYCFVDNPNIISIPSQTIYPNVAKALTIFHRFPTRGKHRVLPLLGQIFSGDRGIVFIHFPLQVQQWFEYILTLTNAELEDAKIWFTRYCQNSYETLREVQQIVKTFAQDSDAYPSGSEASSPQEPDRSTETPPALFQPIDAHSLSSQDPLSQNIPSPNPDSHATESISALPVSRLGSILPGKLWLWLVLMSLFLGVTTALLCPQGIGLGGWFFLLVSLSLQAFSTTTSNRVLQKLQGGILIVAIILRMIFASEESVGGYVAGLLMGLGIGNILRVQFIQTQKQLPQGLSGLWEMISDRTGAIALATSLFFFALPLVVI